MSESSYFKGQEKEGTLFLHNLEIKQFRCFDHKRFAFSKQFTLVTGNNGTGKTSLAEAIHYLCYMKSFRCTNVADLMSHESNSFFLKGNFTTELSQESEHSIQVGYADKKKAIKLDNKAVTTYKQIFELFQVITLLEEDIHLIKGYPSERRSFIDQAALFLDAAYVDSYRSFKRIVQHRNALLHAPRIDKLEFEIWTEKLWAASLQVQQQRKEVLLQIQNTVNMLLKDHFEGIYEVVFDYEAVHTIPNESFNVFKSRLAPIFLQEQAFKRSLFGAHLDDFHIQLKGQKARFFASRGQQKLVSLLCKLSLVYLAEQNSFLPVIIIDDFIADFDEIRLTHIMKFLVSCKNQVIITTPFYDSELKKIIGSVDPEIISMGV